MTLKGFSDCRSILRDCQEQLDALAETSAAAQVLCHAHMPRSVIFISVSGRFHFDSDPTPNPT